ncbi:SAM-dependent methyltransferase [Mycobacterium manitobense]|uniref:S-adenosyl-L-methionine-dependent methyltransferase n=1 Tax=[Mycobacterium] manitobense TaxID=190147 RepID=A0A9X3BPV0_9MYCO|nr:SAM-dependent methyltransferase [[Mycobacterium] manitobense]MCV7173024.1 SAM-dependent methyltransferase [[Mycobacterium] manitobense]
MARTDSDTWSITEGVGPTALGVAMARAGESSAGCPLFDDPFAQVFIDAAVALGWELPTGAMAERIRAVSGYAASRTKWFDEFFIAAGAHGVEQSVILGAGLDSRAWRMPWVSGSVVYEIDQPQVLEFKLDVLRAHGAEPNARYVPVPVDLRQDWPKALRDAGFDATQPAAWSAEGLLPYLPAEGQDRLFAQIIEMAVPSSRIAVESFGAAFFDPANLAARREQLRRLREDSGDDGPDIEDLWFVEERTDVAQWLTAQGWEVTSIDARRLMDRYDRCTPDDAEDAFPNTVFVDARLSSAASTGPIAAIA